MSRLPILALACLALACLVSPLAGADRGSADAPLRVMLIPADGGTEDGTKADFQPVFSAVTRSTGLHFDIKVGQSYSSVIEGMANAQVDIGFFGPVSYLQARERGGAELLAVAVEKGQSIYFSGVFAKPGIGVKTVADLKGAGRTLALGDVNSTSSFAYPLAMILAGGVDPVQDFSRIIMAGSHANSLKALEEGKVDVCCASFDSFEKAVNQKAIDPARFVVLGKSEPIPYPPLAMHPKLPAATKAKLKQAFATVHQAPGVTKDMIRGYGGKKVDRYDTTISEDVFTAAGAKLNAINDALKAEILKKAGAGK